MALKIVIPFPIFAPISTTTTTTSTTSTTELRFSRWNNANAEKFERNRRTQQQIEDDLRRLRRFESALNISTINDSATPAKTTPNFKSTGTPSVPSLSSIPGKKSKYSKPVKNPNRNPKLGNSTHPAFRRVPKRAKLPETGVGGETDIRVGENGVTYVVPGAPFEYMYSYTETPKNVRPVGLREPAVAPFGPGTMPRPWTGRKPLPGSKKELPQFDSFRVPEAGKKGVKPVQKPGPFLPGSGPRYVVSREEVLGEPLTEDEVKELVEGCRRTKRQLNMGRDGLTHNMLDNIHAHWKRRRVCKIKCKGVCTVDMDNVCQQLEEKTGGSIIYRRGGIVFLFRGRNYNYKTRPRFPLMLWKPVTPVYPRLVARVPEGLTLEEASDMRRRGRELIPICKLGKNGVYVNLAKHVREAFEACEMVRINCQGLNPSDYRKIGAKLKDMVPCVLISFENEHILMWRGRDWKSSLLLPEVGAKSYKISETDSAELHGSDSDTAGDSVDSEDEEESSSSINLSKQEIDVEMLNLNNGLGDDLGDGLEVGVTEMENKHFVKDDASLEMNVNSVLTQSGSGFNIDGTDDLEVSPGKSSGDSALYGEPQGVSESHCSPLSSSCTEGVLYLLSQAVESGSAVILDASSLDADMVYERSVAFAQVAPRGPVFRHRPRKVAIQKSKELKTGDTEANEATPVVGPVTKSNAKKSEERKSSVTQKVLDFKQEILDVVPQGSLRIDELAKLLS